MHRNFRTIASTIALCAVALPAYAGLAPSADPATGASEVLAGIDGTAKAVKSDVTTSPTIRDDVGLLATQRPDPASKVDVALPSRNAEPVIPETPTKLLIGVALLCAVYVYPKQRPATFHLAFR